MDFNMKAEVTTLEIQGFSFTGLLAENGELGIGVPQLAAIEVVPHGRSIKQLEGLTGLTFQSHQKWITPLNPKAVNVLSIDEFLQVVRVLALSGNRKAIEFAVVLAGVSLPQLLYDKFHIPTTALDRQQWLKDSESKVSSDAALIPEPTITDQLNTIIAQQQQMIELLSNPPQRQKKQLTPPPREIDRYVPQDPSSPNSWVLTPEIIAYVAYRVAVSRSGQTIAWDNIRGMYRPPLSTRCLRKSECFDILDHLADSDRGAWCGNPYYSKFKVFAFAG